MHKTDQWNQDYYKVSPIFNNLSLLIKYFSNFNHWPDISDYQSIFSDLKMTVTPVPQSSKVNCFEEQYEPRIYLKQELQTRTENWHDFFNALIWLSFPKTKSALNKLHFEQSSERQIGSNRSTLENRITQFDESGAIIISNDNSLLDLIRTHQWKQLFIDNRDRFNHDIKCIIFGHAIYEKSLAPYIGMTCHSLLIHDSNILESSNSSYEELDDYICRLWLDKIAKTPIKHQPYPVLGTPGLWPDQSLEFYENDRYFRPLAK